MKCIFTAAAAAAILIGVAGSASASGFPAGKYTIQFFQGPHHVPASKECLVFSRNGQVAGFKNSGYWTTLNPSGENGNYVYDEGTLRFYGSFPDPKYNEAINVYVDVATGQGGFDVWKFSAPPIQARADGTITMTRDCL